MDMSDNANKFGTFQSTLPRRERHTLRRALVWDLSCFNPRSREGSDEVRLRTFGIYRVSIHAPAKGAKIKESRIKLL